MTSRLVQSPQITQLIDDETGRQLSAYDLVGSDQIVVQRLYMRLHLSRASGEERILCALCGVPVYLCGMPDRERYFFKHFQEDGSCPAVTRGNLSEEQINALRYQGQRESRRHIRLKMLLAESIRADPAFSEPVIEGTWKGKSGKEYRRPDVRSSFNHQLVVAFEVQLSTTFGRVMAERELFYKRNGGLLVWIFGEFEFEQDRLIMQVVFANNNRNAFIVNEATRDASLQAGALILECRWLQPSLHDASLSWTPHRRLVRFDELTFDQDGQRAFYVDTDAIQSQLEAELEGPPIAAVLEDFWLGYESFDGRSCPDAPTLNRDWAGLQRRCMSKGVLLPSRRDVAFRNLIRILYLAKLGCSVGWHYPEFWGAAHRVHDAHKPLLWIFISALRHYGRLSGLEAMDHHGKWAWKMNDWKDGIATRDPQFEEDHCFDDVIGIAFPEISHLVPAEEPIPA